MIHCDDQFKGSSDVCTFAPGEMYVVAVGYYRGRFDAGSRTGILRVSIVEVFAGGVNGFDSVVIV